VGIEEWDEYVTINPEFVRPSEIDVLIGDSTLAHDELGWRPEHTFEDLVYSMIYQDCLRKGVVDMVKKKDESAV
jgi:GDPmannose 4,6-dehydratase